MAVATSVLLISQISVDVKISVCFMSCELKESDLEHGKVVDASARFAWCTPLQGRE
jgi:hypothetical protein